ncbi:MAG: hypothetical protein UMR38_02910 [Candidatus Izemoplasma sp.]|nr:hypothetical protein [Candidatus Izemoplasma sp.]
MFNLLGKYSPVLLKIAIFFLALPALFIIGFLVYNIITGVLTTISMWYLYPIYGFVSMAAIVFIFALWTSYQIVLLVGKNNFKSDQGYTGCHQLMTRLFLIDVLFFVQMPFWFMVADGEDAPGLIILMAYITGSIFT